MGCLKSNLQAQEVDPGKERLLMLVRLVFDIHSSSPHGWLMALACSSGFGAQIFIITRHRRSFIHQDLLQEVKKKTPTSQLCCLDLPLVLSSYVFGSFRNIDTSSSSDVRWWSQMVFFSLKPGWSLKEQRASAPLGATRRVQAWMEAPHVLVCRCALFSRLLLSCWLSFLIHFAWTWNASDSDGTWALALESRMYTQNTEQGVRTSAAGFCFLDKDSISSFCALVQVAVPPPPNPLTL